MLVISFLNNRHIIAVVFMGMLFHAQFVLLY